MRQRHLTQARYWNCWQVRVTHDGLSERGTTRSLSYYVCSNKYKYLLQYPPRGFSVQRKPILRSVCSCSKGWWIVNARLAFIFASARNFDSFNYETEPSKCFTWNQDVQVHGHWNVIQLGPSRLLALQKIDTARQLCENDKKRDCETREIRRKFCWNSLLFDGIMGKTIVQKPMG